jgi:hypothetical protein
MGPSNISVSGNFNRSPSNISVSGNFNRSFMSDRLEDGRVKDLNGSRWLYEHLIISHLPKYSNYIAVVHT